MVSLQHAPLPCLLMLAACCPNAPAAAPTAAASSQDARCTVWNRELSFAKSVADHDAKAFSEHVLDGAVFVSDTTSHGRDAIVKAWDGLIHVQNARFVWGPTEVVVTSDPHVAMSRGPVFTEIMKPGAPTRFRLGAFQSTWVLDKDGVWRVAIDGGQDPKEVSAEEFEKAKASFVAACPPEAR